MHESTFKDFHFFSFSSKEKFIFEKKWKKHSVFLIMYLVDYYLPW